MTDYLTDPLFREAVQSVVAPLLRSTSRATVARTIELSPTVRVTRGRVISVDVDAGTADIHVDGDPPTRVAAALLVGPSPAEDSRCLVMFTPAGDLFCLGTIGEPRFVLPGQGSAAVASDSNPFQIGDDDGPNIAFTYDTIQARDTSKDPPTPADLRINPTTGSYTRIGAYSIGPGPGTGICRGHVSVFGPESDNGPNGWQERFASDATIRFNLADASFGVVANGDFATTLFLLQYSGGNVVLRTPAGLPTLGGTAPLGIVTGGGVNQIGIASSSARYKHLVRDVVTDDLLAVVNRLRPVRFRYRPHDGVTDEAMDAHIAPSLGLIAEEVAPLIPEAVAANDQGEPEAIDPNAMIGALVGAVQALTARVEQLQAEVADLKANAIRTIG